MKKFSFPAVIFRDDEADCFCVAISDVNIFCDGETVEQAHKRAGEFLNAYIDFALANDMEIPEPTPFKDVVLKYPKNLVVLVESIVDNKNKTIK